MASHSRTSFPLPGSELVAVPTVQTAVEIDAFTKAAVHLQMFEKLREVRAKDDAAPLTGISSGRSRGHSGARSRRSRARSG
jgi:hypothetical protein